MRIRPRDDADIAACVDLLAAVHAADGYPVNLPADPKTFLVTPDMLGAWIAEDGENVVGHVALRPRTSAGVMEKAAAAAGVGAERLAVVARLLVAPGARRRGVGWALLGAAARRASELGRHPVLDVVKGHAAAVALYDRAGWRRAGEVQVTFPTGQTVNELVFVAPGGATA
jgi:GNAT superfamily N-acetyltransferase